MNLASLLDGPIEVALLCGDSEPSDPAYERCTVDFEDGSNTEECRFGPYERSFRQPVTGYALYRDGELLGRRPLSPAKTPVEAETSVFAAGSIKLEIS